MSIPGQQNINVGLPNESANSDSLYTAFTKTQENFANLFDLSSPYNTFTAGAGIAVDANANIGTVTVTNTGVRNIIAGTNIVINQANGNVTISATGSGNGGGLSSVGLNPASTSVSPSSISSVISNPYVSPAQPLPLTNIRKRASGPSPSRIECTFFCAFSVSVIISYVL